jgi:NhaA family Na+:H+ antiporter
MEAAAAGALLLATALALLVANSPWASVAEHFWESTVGLRIGSVDYERPLREWINDGLMTLFFFVVALELKRELVLGELRKPRTAAFSVLGALGGMVVPAAIFLLLRGGQAGHEGWGTVVATDTAFVIGCLTLLGTRIPAALRVFVLSLAIVDDVGAMLVIAVGYSEGIHWGAVILALVGIGCLRVLALAGVRGFAPFVVVGLSMWAAIDASGMHPTVTGVVVGLLTPARRWVDDERLYALLDQVIAHPTLERGSGVTADRQTLQVAEVAARESLSPVERLEFLLHPWIAFLVMPLFALANAGLDLRLLEVDGWLVGAIVAGLLLGKPLGILSFCWLAVRTGLATRAPELSWGLLAGGGLLSGIGFTMSLFIAQLAFPDALIDSAKLGVFVASILAACSGLVVLVTFSRTPPVYRSPGTIDVSAPSGLP